MICSFYYLLKGLFITYPYNFFLTKRWEICHVKVQISCTGGEKRNISYSGSDIAFLTPKETLYLVRVIPVSFAFLIFKRVTDSVKRSVRVSFKTLSALSFLKLILLGNFSFYIRYYSIIESFPSSLSSLYSLHTPLFSLSN